MKGGINKMTDLLTKEKIREIARGSNFDAELMADKLVAQYKEVLQESLEAEMDNELGYSKYNWKNKDNTNSRNGHSKKTVSSRFGKMDLKIPRDTEGSFEPVTVRTHERIVNPSIDDKIISMYAKGMSTRDINDQIKEIYGIDVSADMVSRITDKVIPLAKEWQNRPLQEVYPLLFLDGIVFNIRQDGQITNKTAYVVYAINLEGMKEILGIWIGEAESAKFWMNVVCDLQTRGVKDILIASVDGLNGFEEAIHSVFPNTEIQRCIVHQIRTSTKFVSYKDRKKFCSDMKEIYNSPNEKAGLAALDKFEGIWGKQYPYAIKSWRNNWKNISTFFKYPQEIRKIIYTTNHIENFNRTIRKVTKTKSSFPTEESLLKLLYLIVMDKTEKWTMPVHNWGLIINQLGIYFKERLASQLMK
jgi:putative transposase